jgi:Na+/H+ antiporter NhaD/arsenite permease-like protein
MRARARRLLAHPVVRKLLFERLLITASAALALAAVAMGHVRASEIPGLLDSRLLTLFFVLTVAVELGKHSDLFDELVAAVVRRARHARALAFALLGVTALSAALLTNDVALLLVVPFTMLFRKVTDMDLTPLVVLEIAAANLLGALTPIGNPQNLFLYSRGGFTAGGFLSAQLPFVAGAAALLAAAVPLLVPKRRFEPPEAAPFDVDPMLAAGFVLVLAAEIAAIAGLLPSSVPLAFSLVGVWMLGRRVWEADFSLVFVFAFLFIGIEGLERGRLYRALDLERIFGHGPTGLLISGALLSQVVSNVPAAMLLAPAARAPQGFTALLYGVNAGGCGTPIASLANLIGAQLYRREGGRSGVFWRLFLPTSFALLVALLLFCLALVRVGIR